MANNVCPHRRKPQAAPAPAAVFSPPAEPEMRRWPHPVGSGQSAADNPAHYLHCTLAYQNQLLAEIKSLLEQIALQCAAKEGEK